MKGVHKILKISAKEAFKNLRGQAPFFCTSLNKEVFVTKLFWNHINFSKQRTIREVIYRLATIPLIARILAEGKTVKVSKNFFQINLTLQGQTFSVIILQDLQRDNKCFLLSCFLFYKQQK